MIIKIFEVRSISTSRLTPSHSQRLNSRKLGTGCEWLWSIGTGSNETLPDFWDRCWL